MDKLIGLLAFFGIGYIGYTVYTEWREQNNSESNESEKHFRLASGRIVRESELPSNGYRKTKFGWVDERTFFDIQNRLKQGSTWTSILNHLQYINWSALTDKDGNRVDINEPFSTTPTDWGLDDWGNIAGVNCTFINQETLY